MAIERLSKNGITSSTGSPIWAPDLTPEMLGIINNQMRGGLIPSSPVQAGGGNQQFNSYQQQLGNTPAGRIGTGISSSDVPPMPAGRGIADGIQMPSPD